MSEFVRNFIHTIYVYTATVYLTLKVINEMKVIEKFKLYSIDMYLITLKLIFFHALLYITRKVMFHMVFKHLSHDFFQLHGKYVLRAALYQLYL